ncbi:MAG: LytTR family DNA-binding domain-containing protein [Bacteroidota bacterium]
MTVNCIAVDDEPAALNLVTSYIEQTPFLQLVGKFNNALDALREIHSNPAIQLVFLDIRMSDLNGVELARIIEQSDRKKNLKVIFTTAYDQYAVEGFKVDALDYMVKPFSFVDFSKAASKAFDYFMLLGSSTQPTGSKMIQMEDAKPYVYVKVEHQLVKVDIESIRYIESLKDYVKIYMKQSDKPLLTLTSLKKLQEKLPGNLFLRLHRSFIVSTSAITSATKTSVQIGETTIPVSEQFKEPFNEFLSKWVL